MPYESRSNKKPRATTWFWSSCPNCPYAHLVLCDENGEPFADMTLSEEQVEKFTGDMNSVLEEARPKVRQ